MAACAYCGTTILFGGIKDDDLRFCNDECFENGYALVIARSVSDNVVKREANKIYNGACPKCQGIGPVDVHVSHRVYSVLLYSSWSSIPNICCRSCGLKSQASNALFSLFCGWWGFPYGLIMTPIQIVRNIFGMARPPEEFAPSEKLENLVRIDLATQYIEEKSMPPPVNDV